MFFCFAFVHSRVFTSINLLATRMGHKGPQRWQQVHKTLSWTAKQTGKNILTFLEIHYHHHQHRYKHQHHHYHCPHHELGAHFSKAIDPLSWVTSENIETNEATWVLFCPIFWGNLLKIQHIYIYNIYGFHKFSHHNSLSLPHWITKENHSYIYIYMISYDVAQTRRREHQNRLEMLHQYNTAP